MRRLDLNSVNGSSREGKTRVLWPEFSCFSVYGIQDKRAPADQGCSLHAALQSVFGNQPEPDALAFPFQINCKLVPRVDQGTMVWRLNPVRIARGKWCLVPLQSVPGRSKPRPACFRVATINR